MSSYKSPDSLSAVRISLILAKAFSARLTTSSDGSPSSPNPAPGSGSGSATESANWDIEEKESWRDVTIAMSWGVRVLRTCIASPAENSWSVSHEILRHKEIELTL